MEKLAQISIGPVQLHFYGFMYALGAVGAFYITKWYARKKKVEISGDELSSIVFWTMIGGVIGGRLLYVFVYNFSYFITHPAQIPAVWNGGMSIHGGLLGGCIGLVLITRYMKKSFWTVADIFAPSIAFGLALGRIGNFVNGELPGRITDVPWGVDFGDGENRHPSSLYAAGKDLLLFGILLFLGLRKKLPTAALAGFFLSLLGIFRFSVEFFRRPDPQLGFLALGLSMGQWLSIILFLIGITVLIFAFQKKTTHQK